MCLVPGDADAHAKEGWLCGKMVESGQRSAGLKGITAPPPQIWSQSEALTCLGDDNLSSEKQWAEKERNRKMGGAYRGEERAFAPGGCFQ